MIIEGSLEGKALVSNITSLFTKSKFNGVLSTQKFKEEDKPLAVVLRYDNKSEPKIDFQRTIELEPKTEKVNLGILGAGNFASSTILPILKELKKDCQILGIASSTGLSSASLAKTFKIKNKYPTEEEILNADEIDAVLILTPHFNHSELVIKALNKGKAIYVEKPLALNDESIIEIEEAIYNSENPKLFVGSVSYTHLTLPSKA